jgi:hypothetical protein
MDECIVYTRVQRTAYLKLFASIRQTLVCVTFLLARRLIPVELVQIVVGHLCRATLDTLIGDAIASSLWSALHVHTGRWLLAQRFRHPMWEAGGYDPVPRDPDEWVPVYYRRAILYLEREFYDETERKMVLQCHAEAVAKTEKHDRQMTLILCVAPFIFFVVVVVIYAACFYATRHVYSQSNTAFNTPVEL